MKKKYVLKASLILILGSISVFSVAQINIAENTNATFTASTTAGGLGANRINDGVINPCGFEETQINGVGGSTTDWLMAEFNQVETVNTIRIYVGEKNFGYLSGATVQKRVGGVWVDHYAFTVPYDNLNLFSNPCDYFIKMPSVTGDSLRLTKFNISGTNTSFTIFREIEMFNLLSNDAGFSNVGLLFGAGNLPVEATLTNFGLNRVDSANVDWSVNGVSQTGFKFRDTATGLFFNDTLKLFKDTIITLGNFNFIGNTAYTIKVWSGLPNNVADAVPSNDTFTYTFTAVGKPAPPVLEDQFYCGVAAPLLKGIGASGTMLNWYSDPLGANYLVSGDSIQLTQSYSPLDTVQFYGKSSVSFTRSHKEAKMSGIWSFTGGGNPQTKGVFVNIMPKYDIFLDSLDVAFTRPAFVAAGPYDVELYYKAGKHNGFETNVGAWTLATTTSTAIPLTPAASLPITPTRIPTGGLFLKANTQYALYYQIKGVNNTVRTNCSSGSQGGNPTTVENEVLIVEEGALSVFDFGTNTTAQGFIAEAFYYYSLLFESDSAVANIHLHPKPTGSSIDGQAGSLGTFNSGFQTDPDYVTNGETIEYELTAPTGYADADFGTTWEITAFSIETASGTAMDVASFMQVPPNPGKGTLSITPQASEVDSLFKITMIVADLGPYNCDSIVERWVYVAPRPFANFSIPVTNCDGDGIFFDNLSTIESGFMTHKWCFMDASMNKLDSSDAINPVYTFPTYGTYFVKLEASNAVYGYSDDTTIQVTVGEIPTIDIKAVNACEGIAVNFLNSTTASTATPTFMWDFGDGGTSILTSPSHLYGAPGGYPVKLIATAGGCSSEKTINAYQFAKPVSDFTLPTGQVCSRKEIMLNNTTTIAIGAAGAYWNFDDGVEISTDLNPTYQFTTGGSFDIKLISVSEFGCQDSMTQTLAVDLSPATDFSEDQYCENEMTQFTNESSDMGAGYGIVWDFGDGATSTLENPGHNWTSIGPKTVKLRVTAANGCFEEKVKNIEVLPQPFVDFTAEDGCSGVPISFENLSSTTKGELSYVWDFGGSTSTDGAPTYAYTVSASSSRNVTLTATVPNGCPAEITKAVNIEPNPVCGFTWNDTFISPMGRGVYFRATAQTGTTYSWVMGVDGPGPDASEFFHQFTFFRPYDVKLSIQSPAGCKCESTNTVQFPPSSVKTIEEIGVKVYPNPSNAIVNIEGSKIESVKIYNAEGKLVYTSSKLTATNTINISNWASGIYQVEVSNVAGSGVVKLIKL